MIHNPYRKAVNIGGSLLGLATLISTGVAVHSADHLRANLASAPNYGLHDGEYRMETECLDAPFCPIRTVAIDVRGGQIANIDVGYHDVNRNSHSRNTRAVRELSQSVIQSQSADNLDFVTGATVTSTMFKSTLQHLINEARG